MTASVSVASLAQADSFNTFFSEAHCFTMAGAPKSAAPPEPTTPGNNIMGKQEDAAVDTILLGTDHRDLAYINKKRIGGKHIIPFLGSCLRDGTLENAFNRQQNNNAELWAPSSERIRNLGQTYCKSLCMEHAPAILSDAVFASHELVLNAQQFLRSVCCWCLREGVVLSSFI